MNLYLVFPSFKCFSSTASEPSLIFSIILYSSVRFLRRRISFCSFSYRCDSSRSLLIRFSSLTFQLSYFRTHTLFMNFITSSFSLASSSSSGIYSFSLLSPSSSLFLFLIASITNIFVSYFNRCFVAFFSSSSNISSS